MHRRILAIGILTCLCLVSGLGQDQMNDPENEKSYDLFLLIGQSNMAGRGVVSEEDLHVHPQVLTFNKENIWVPAIDPIHFDKPIAGVGPGRSFGIAVAVEHPGNTIGLIPCAVGGSPISSWEPGALDAATQTHPYDVAVRRTVTALKSGTLKAILWHQGESDSNMTSAPLYEERLVTLINRLRTEFGDPGLPFIIGQLGQFSENPWDQWKKTVDEAQKEVALNTEGVYFVCSGGLGHKGDTLHFSSDAARELGRRYAQVYNNLRSQE